MMKRRLQSALTGLLLALAATSLRANPETIVVGVLSFRPEALALAQWKPLTDYLNRSVPSAHFELRVLEYGPMQEAVRQQAVDLVITQPGEYVRMVHQNGLSTPLASLINLENRQPVRAMGGVILARSERQDLRNLKDLQGQRIATVSRLSFGGYQIQATELARQSISPGRLVETGLPQDRVIDALLANEADVAYVRTGLLETLVREGRLKPGELKVLGQQNYPGYPYALSSRLYPEWPVVAMSHLPEDLSVRIAGALLSLPHGGDTARRMGIYGFTVPADYEPVRAMMRELRAPPFDKPPVISWSDIWQQYGLLVASAVLTLLLMLLMALRETWLRQRMDSFSNAMGEGMFVLDRQGYATYVNRAACRLLGYQREALLGKQLLPLILSPANQPPYLGGVNPLLDPQRWQQPYEGENVFVSASGKTFPVEVSSRPVRRKDRFVRTVTVFSDISERKAHSEHVYHLAYHDALTGLPNRRLLFERLQESLGRNSGGSRGALLFSDLDRFKQINDTLGHKVGDALLQAVAGRMLRVIGDQGLVAHTGGDEFAVLLEGLDPDAERASAQARNLAEKLRSSMHEPFGIDSQYHQMSVSIGVALFDGPDTGADELLKRADIAMYEAKASGRNAIRFFDHDIAMHLSQRVALEAELNQALALQQFRVFYQPQFDSSGRMVGAEALVRWLHPQRGLVMPGQFIPLAEETGLILPLGQWVLDHVCQQIERWRGQPVLGELVISVNLCAHQLLQANFVESVTSVLMATGADASRLQLELTESVLAHNIDDATHKMRRLVALGVQFALDDFGTGYSSLSYLKRLPIQQLKIDASFVRDLQTDPNDVVITQTIIALGQSLGLEVIAEGVETEAQRDILRQQGCQLFQGYFYARPQALADLVDLVHKVHPLSQESPP
ncbi:EAL domain-containing protein [Rhodoferax sp. BAB1]|uniref:EAL domain-containing protein n=1 Tax=Rhodoferax sp. BAB1 TaxID=2741720 RepID=UPI00157590BD|nr:EAL domain-containing protein [Rhodoferax sp. BAB1]QKO21392.1 EAL domain-containing protein [Rhodoferax sp. BAB1]